MSDSFGRYHLIAELGSGGMADVFLAVQPGPVGSGFQKLSVIKRLRQNLVDDPDFVDMLIEEARIAARLNHPNVVQTNEVGQVGDQYFIAMEYLDGQPLHRLQHRARLQLKEHGSSPIGIEHQLLVIMDALAGLHHAHELRDYDNAPLDIVHRDVTPQNIFVTYDGQVKVVDFGIARAAGRATETRQGMVKGKIRYMAPEQALAQPLDRRTDLFSVGIMLWEILAGRRFWKDKDDLEIVRHLAESSYPRSVREVAPATPDELERICWKALAPLPEDRHATAEELRLELEEYLVAGGHLVTVRRQLPSLLTEIFADKRATIRNVIEEQLELLRMNGVGAPRSIPAVPISRTTTTIAPPTLVSAASSTHGIDVSVTRRSPDVDEALDDGRPWWASRAVLAVAVVAVLGSVALAGVAALRSRANQADAATEPARAVANTSVHLGATPAGARISVDGAPARPAPLDLEGAVDDQPHRLRIEADGHVARNETVRFTPNLSMTIALEPEPPPAAKSEPAGSAPVAARGRSWRPASPPVAARPAASPPPVATPAPPAPAPTEPRPPKPRRPKTEIDNGDPWAEK